LIDTVITISSSRPTVLSVKFLVIPVGLLLVMVVLTIVVGTVSIVSGSCTLRNTAALNFIVHFSDLMSYIEISLVERAGAMDGTWTAISTCWASVSHLKR
jgi:hypothetical protein